MKTADQAQNQTESHQKPYAEDLPLLSRPKLGDPISLAFWGSAELEFPTCLAYLAETVFHNREMLIGSVYQKIQNPLERFAFGWGLLFAFRFYTFTKRSSDWRTAEPYKRLPKILDLPGFDQEYFGFTYSCVLFAITEAFHTQRKTLNLVLKKLGTEEAIELAQAMRLSEKITESDCGLGARSFKAQFVGLDSRVFDMLIKWLDRWADELINPEKYNPSTAAYNQAERANAARKAVEELEKELAEAQKQLSLARLFVKKEAADVRRVNKLLIGARREICLAAPHKSAKRKRVTR